MDVQIHIPVEPGFIAMLDVQWQADPDRKASRPEDRKRRGTALLEAYS